MIIMSREIRVLENGECIYITFDKVTKKFHLGKSEGDYMSIAYNERIDRLICSVYLTKPKARDHRIYKGPNLTQEMLNEMILTYHRLANGYA